MLIWLTVELYMSRPSIVEPELPVVRTNKPVRLLLPWMEMRGFPLYPGCDVPSIITGLLIHWISVKLMTWVPEPEILKSMVVSPGVEFDCWIAHGSEFEVFTSDEVLVTVKVDGRSLLSRISRRGTNVRFSPVDFLASWRLLVREKNNIVPLLLKKKMVQSPSLAFNWRSRPPRHNSRLCLAIPSLLLILSFLDCVCKCGNPIIHTHCSYRSVRQVITLFIPSPPAAPRLGRRRRTTLPDRDANCGAAVP